MYKIYEHGTVELELNLLEGEARLPETSIQVSPEERKAGYVQLYRKKEYHITIVSAPLGKDLRYLEAAAKADGSQPLYKYIEFLMRTYRWHFFSTGAYYELRREDPTRPMPPVYTFIELEFMPDYWAFYAELRRLLPDLMKLREEQLPPPHTTLLTSAEDRKTAIGIPDRESWERMLSGRHTHIKARRLEPKEVEELVESSR